MGRHPKLEIGKRITKSVDAISVPHFHLHSNRRKETTV